MEYEVKSNAENHILTQQLKRSRAETKKLRAKCLDLKALAKKQEDASTESDAQHLVAEMKKILNDGKEEKEITPLDGGKALVAETESVIKETENAAVSVIKESNEEDKDKLIETLRATLSRLKATKSKDSNAVMDKIKWSSSYLADQYPLAVTAVAMSVTMGQFVDSYLVTEECGADYKFTEWGMSTLSQSLLLLLFEADLLQRCCFLLCIFS